MKILIEGTVAEFLVMSTEQATVPLTANGGKRIGTAVVHRNGMIEAEADDEEIARQIRGKVRGGYSLG